MNNLGILATLSEVKEAAVKYFEDRFGHKTEELSSELLVGFRRARVIMGGIEYIWQYCPYPLEVNVFQVTPVKDYFVSRTYIKTILTKLLKEKCSKGLRYSTSLSRDEFLDKIKISKVKGKRSWIVWILGKEYKVEEVKTSYGVRYKYGQSQTDSISLLKHLISYHLEDRTAIRITI